MGPQEAEVESQEFLPTGPGNSSLTSTPSISLAQDLSSSGETSHMTHSPDHSYCVPLTLAASKSDSPTVITSSISSASKNHDSTNPPKQGKMRKRNRGDDSEGI